MDIRGSNEGSDIIHNIVSLDCSIKASIQDLWKCTNIGDLQNVINLTRTNIYNLKTLIESLETLALETDDLDTQGELKEAARFYKEQLESTQVAMRKAIVNSKQRIDGLAKNELFNTSSISEARLRKGAAQNRENMSRTAKDITQNLLSISRAMHNSVNQSTDTLTTLVSSSKTISKTHEDLKDQHGHIKTSRNLLTKYGRREYTDKFLIFLALVFFFSTVLYILKNRLYPN